ncbi:hypothetical protein [Desulfovibrio legallii]|jgi:hypothetical protein|uniref:hypothetical protein n=1 Tax=Desulfovibrio legallii TaxID=571438 RepID=UPI0011785B44|nr:hypothetical protein [Desulfovibrio legallii]
MPAPRALQSLGIKIFITEYSFWSSKPENSAALRYQIEKQISNEAGAGIRASAAKKIFSDALLLRECLTYVAFKAKNVDTQIIAQARSLLHALSDTPH